MSPSLEELVTSLEELVTSLEELVTSLEELVTSLEELVSYYRVRIRENTSSITCGRDFVALAASAGRSELA